MKEQQLTFEAVYPKVLKLEGGLSMNPKDRGNWTGGQVGRGELLGTKYGVSAFFLAENIPNLRPKDLTQKQAIDIFHKWFWIKEKCEEMPNEIRAHYFDVAINSGGSRARKILQRAIGVDPDGIIGAKSMAAMNRANLWNYHWERNAFYVKLVEIRPEDIEFLEGWLHRVHQMSMFSKEFLSL